MKRGLNYLEQLRAATKMYRSVICFGIDPVIKALHSKFSGLGIEGFLYMLEELFAYMKEQKVYPGAFKPNYGFYKKHGNRRDVNLIGLEVLCKLLNLIEKEFPDMPIILDAKDGDIGKSSLNYAESAFDFYDVAATTVAPYMGTDSMMPFVEYCGSGKENGNRGTYILNLTSNPGAKDFEMKEMADGDKLYMQVAEWIRHYSRAYPGLGAVVGAPRLEELRDIAKFYSQDEHKVSLLIPGVSGKKGGQGGKLDEVVTVLKDAGYELAIVRTNLSSGLTHPWGETDPAPDDWKKIIVDDLFELNKLSGFA